MAMDIEKQTNAKPREGHSEEYEFTVMPRQVKDPARADDLLTDTDHDYGGFGKYRKIIVLIFLGLVVIVAGGYLLYDKFIKKELDEASDIPAIIIPDQERIEDDKDADGLNVSQEEKHATNPLLSDTDGDGLSDGDEVNIYTTDPMLSDTDGDGFDDGREVAGGYSPLINISQKASSEVIQLWTQRIADFSLHEPTPTTLRLKAPVDATQPKVVYTNVQYKYGLELPAVLTHREADEGRLVGIYISGTNPEGGPLEDPINLSIAVKVTSQTLKEWVSFQYAGVGYDSLEEKNINGIATVRLFGVKDDVCAQNKTFYSKDNTIIVLTWTCNQNTPFAPLYEQIAQSLKFQ